MYLRGCELCDGEFVSNCECILSWLRAGKGISHCDWVWELFVGVAWKGAYITRLNIWVEDEVEVELLFKIDMTELQRKIRP